MVDSECGPSAVDYVGQLAHGRQYCFVVVHADAGAGAGAGGAIWPAGYSYLQRLLVTGYQTGWRVGFGSCRPEAG